MPGSCASFAGIGAKLVASMNGGATASGALHRFPSLEEGNNPDGPGVVATGEETTKVCLAVPACVLGRIRGVESGVATETDRLSAVLEGSW